MRPLNAATAMLVVGAMTSQAGAQESAVDRSSVADQLYDSAEETVAPLTPDEIKRFREQFEERRRAQETPLEVYAPVNRTQRLDLSPGGKIQSIRLAPDHTTNITLLDRNGDPWPIDNARPGNDAIVSVDQNIDHVASLTLGKKYRPTNLTVTLEGLETPLIFSLESAQSEVDYGVTFILPRRKPSSGTGDGGGSESSGGRVASGGGIDVPDWNDDVMAGFLDGVPPEGAKSVPTDASAEARVWHYQGALYVVTKLEMHFPSVGMPLYGTNDWKVYEVPGVDIESSQQPVLTLAQDDMTTHVTVLTEMVQ